MKPQINHETSESVFLVSRLFSCFGGLFILVGLITIIVLSSDYHPVWPGFVVALCGLPWFLVGTVVKGFAVVVRSSETYLHFQGDEKEEKKSSYNYKSVISQWTSIAEQDVKNDENTEPYNPYKDNKV